jgi:hypothetical protein
VKRRGRRRREWDTNLTSLTAERLVKMPRDNIPVGRRWSDLISD